MENRTSKKENAETINNFIIGGLSESGRLDTNDISDGAHTFGELYEDRMMLFSIIINNHKSESWKSIHHSDGTMFPGYFIVGIETPNGQFTYHYELKYWDYFNCQEVYKAPIWDGHTRKDIRRLLGL